MRVIESPVKVLTEDISLNGEARMTVRQFIDRWGAARRGYKVVERIDRDLRKAGLRTDPPYEDVAIDTPIRILPVPATTPDEPGKQPSATIDEIETESEIGLHVGLLPASSAAVTTVKREDELQVAISTMLLNDFSQLVVTSGTDSYWGVISWESIGKARVSLSNPSVSDSSTKPAMVVMKDDLIALVPRIYSEGFVVVGDPNRPQRAGGIITTADLTLQFADLATPFFLLGEVERRIRRRIDSTFDKAELTAVVDPKDQRTVESAGDLTLGELHRLIEAPDNWAKLGWNIDRKTFLKTFEHVREIRNEVMHFSPDPLEAADVKTLRTFVSALRVLP